MDRSVDVSVSRPGHTIVGTACFLARTQVGLLQPNKRLPLFRCSQYRRESIGTATNHRLEILDARFRCRWKFDTVHHSSNSSHGDRVQEAETVCSGHLARAAIARVHPAI
jgi:hypothetical protein